MNRRHRHRLPQRRGAIAVELEHAGHHFRMQIGCFPDGAGSKAWTVHAAQFSETERRAYYKGAQS